LPPIVLSRNRRSQTARATPELQIINEGGEPISRPVTAKPTDAKRQIDRSHVFGCFRTNDQAGTIRIEAKAPIHCPAILYPAARQNTESIMQIKNKIFRGGIGFSLFLTKPVVRVNG
jgi:hypothetical protein